MYDTFDKIDTLCRSHPALRLLRANNAPLIITFLEDVFIRRNVRSISQYALISKLEDVLFVLRRSGSDAFDRDAAAYLEDWAGNDKGWLRKFYQQDSDEPYYDLTSSTEKTLLWVSGLQKPSFVGTGSRLLSIFSLLREIVLKTETDIEARVAELEKKKRELDDEIAALRRGEVHTFDETEVRERFLQFSAMAKELLGDFRMVEQNFRDLDMDVREKIAAWEGGKGELLDSVFGDRDAISDSDQGRSFRAFWDFLMSTESQDELSSLIEKVLAHEALAKLSPDERLRRIHFDWLDAGGRTQRMVSSLSQQLRRYLDTRAYEENRRITLILDSIVKNALAVKDHVPRDAFMMIDELSPEIVLPMERPLYSVKSSSMVDSCITVGEASDSDCSALYNQFYVDRDRLRGNIRRAVGRTGQCSLSDIIAAFPIEQGLAELVAYLSIAGDEAAAVFDDSRSETIRWQDGGVTREAVVPRIILKGI